MDSPSLQGGASRGRSVLRRLLWMPPLDFAAFRTQEVRLIAINVLALVALMVLHGVFAPVVAPLSGLATWLYLGRIGMQVVEAANLRRPEFSLGPRLTLAYSRVSIGLNVAFTAVVAVLCGGQESHYAVLLVVPVMAAAFRESVLGMLVVLAGVTILTVGLVWVPLDSQSPALAWESFAAVTICLIFVAVSVIVRMLAVQLWAQRAALQHSLVDLATARDHLVREEKLAAIGRLSAAIAHEVRNPVSMIRMSVSMARRAGTAPAVRDEVLGIIEKESHRLERMTGDFLAYAREKPPEVRSTSLAETVSLVAGLCRPRAEGAGVTLATECDDATVRIDPFQIHQALLNVALNGIEATPAGGSVKLSARPDASGAVFVVENSGPPLSPEAASRYGEPFFTTRPGGTGLGLPIAITIAKAHGGSVSLVENAPGRVRWQLTVSEPVGARA